MEVGQLSEYDFALRNTHSLLLW